MEPMITAAAADEDPDAVARRLADRLHPGARVAIADGVGAPIAMGAALGRAAELVGGIELVLGWCLTPPVDLSNPAFTRIRTVMAGFGLRTAVADGRVEYVPCRLTAVPALLHGPLRPDALVIAMRPDGGFGTEVSWMPAAISAGARLLVQENSALPAASAEAEKCVAGPVCRIARPPVELPERRPDEQIRRIGARVAELIPEGAALQYGPGPIGTAVLHALTRPVRIASGMVTDAVLDLAARGLLLDAPQAAYVVGTQRLYDWAHGRPIAVGISRSHHGLLDSGAPFVAVNTALEIDELGQVNVETGYGGPVSGIGGHPDFALNGVRSKGGLSVLAMPRARRGRSTLVPRLTAPVSTARTDVDVVVTDLGVADLRGLSDRERRRALASIWS
jgi:acyl-CoA hydrolase